MKMRTFLLIAILACGFACASRIEAQTSTVRGQLLRNGQFPAAGIQVTLNHPTFGRSSAWTTGGDGMYYLYNVPYGDYYLEVWISNPPIVYQVRVIGFPYCDLPRVAVP
jgi:hypothetical protein